MKIVAEVSSMIRDAGLQLCFAGRLIKIFKSFSDEIYKGNTERNSPSLTKELIRSDMMHPSDSSQLPLEVFLLSDACHTGSDLPPRE